MLAQPIPQFFSQEYIPALIGDYGLLLEGNYDPDQHWLPFMGACVIKVRVRTELDDFHDKCRKHIPGQKPHGGPYAREKHVSRQLYHHEKGVDQRVLPFWEARRISKSEYQRLRQSEFPGWDNPPFIIPVSPEHQSAISRWCDTNCQGRYHQKQRYVAVERETDAMMLKVIWQAAKTP